MLRPTLALAVLASAALADDNLPPPDARQPGLVLHTYDVGRLDALRPLVAGQTPNVARYVDVLDLESDGDFGLKDDFLTEATGYLVVDEPGEYAFELLTDDGATMALDGHTLIWFDGPRDATKERAGARERLAAGTHRLEIRHFDMGGHQRLRLRWRPPGAAEFTLVPRDKLFCRSNLVHVTSPGRKATIAPLANTRAGDGEPLGGLHPALDLATLSRDGFQPRVGGLDFLPDGRLVVADWAPRGDVFVVDPKTGAHKVFASGLAEPLGVSVVDGEVYVLQKQELTHLVDTDKDGTADEYRCLNGAWPVTANFHEFAFGLVHRDGWFYAALAVAVNQGGKTTEVQATHSPEGLGRGQVIRVERATGKIEKVAAGLRTPNGIGLAGDDIYVTDNQGDWLPCSKLLKLADGAFYNSHLNPRDDYESRPVTPPVAWLPQGEIGRSPGQPVECQFGPWKGQILHGDVTLGGIQRTCVETVEGVAQGATMRLTQGLAGGVNRLAWGPDGALYVGAIGAPGNWGQDGKQWFGLQKLTYNGGGAFDLLSVSARQNGFELTLTEPLADDVGTEPTHYALEQYRYEPTSFYGGDKVDTRALAVKSATVSADRRRVFLEVGDLKEGHVVHVRLADVLRDARGAKLWSTEAWYTLNKLPSTRGEVGSQPVHNTLTDAEKSAGWRLLFDGATTNGWLNADAWKAEAGELRTGRGDVRSADEFGDFELAYDWKVGTGGNSGVFYRVEDGVDPGWASGVEMQVLDNRVHPDGRKPETSAGGVYALVAPSRDASLGADRWHTARVVARGPRVEHWLNGEKIAEYDTSSDAWRTLVAASKFKDMPKFAKATKGRIVLQDHGDPVAFRNVKVRAL